MVGMTSQPGWYDDPWDPRRYRYWDGNSWTGHSSPKYRDDTGQPGTPQAGPQAPEYGGFAGGPGLGNVPLSGWWRRVGARLLDGLIVTVLALPLTAYFYARLFDAYGDYLRRIQARVEGGAPPRVIDSPQEIVQWALLVGLITTAVYVLYEAIMLRRRGATFGKRAAGVQVRTVNGNSLPWSVVARRVLFYFGLSLLSAIPVAGILFAVAGLLDVLWPLWDHKHQALHDKVAGTVVVRAFG